MINTKNFQIRKVDNVDGSVNCEVGILVKAKHVIPAARVLKLAVQGDNHVEMECRAQVRPLKAAVLNHIYGDLTSQVQQLKTLAKLCATKKYELEIRRVCTEIDKLLNMSI